MTSTSAVRATALATVHIAMTPKKPKKMIGTCGIYAGRMIQASRLGCCRNRGRRHLMPRKTHHCIEVGCGKPCWGARCRPHALAFGVLNYKTGVVITGPSMPTSSWWTEKDFAAAYARELPRLLTVKVSGNERPNVVFD
jgi:hypothetical protein